MGYFGSSGGVLAQPHSFVRVDITYLKQDYSVILPGQESGPFQGRQRYDLFVRERFSTSADLEVAVARHNAGLTPQQKAVAFALRELTGEAAGPGAANWRRFSRIHKQVVHER